MIDKEIFIRFLSLFLLVKFTITRWKNFIFSIGLCTRLLFIAFVTCCIHQQSSALHSERICTLNISYSSFSNRNVCLCLDNVRKRWFSWANSTAQSTLLGTLSNIFILFSCCLADHSSCTSQINSIEIRENETFIKH